jgi:hypothetical protein
MLWCLGMYASGSTWAFNAAMKVAAVVVPRTPAVGRFVTRHDELEFLDDPMRLPIVKSHDTDAAAAAALASRADPLLASIRDPRDCITSLMLYQHYGFDLALATIERTARFCARFVSHPNAVLLRYEAGFIDDPATLDRIATSLGGCLTAVDRDRIFMETRRPAIEAHIARLDALPSAVRDESSGDLVDMATLWHTHHSHRSGEIGRWRHMLSPRQIAVVEQNMRDWMAAFGYAASAAPYTLTVGSMTIEGG